MLPIEDRARLANQDLMRQAGLHGDELKWQQNDKDGYLRALQNTMVRFGLMSIEGTTAFIELTDNMTRDLEAERKNIRRERWRKRIRLAGLIVKKIFGG